MLRELASLRQEPASNDLHAGLILGLSVQLDGADPSYWSLPPNGRGHEP